MSRITELANAEADAIEAAEVEGTAGEGEAPPADEAPPAKPDTAAAEPSANLSVDKALAQMEKENGRHAEAVARIMGADFALVYPCQHCQEFAAGFTFTNPNEEPPMQHPDDYERCGRCNGYGLVLTGAVSEHGRTQTCLTCNGQGFVQKAPEPVAALYSAPTPAASEAQTTIDALRAAGYMVIDPPASPRAV